MKIKELSQSMNLQTQKKENINLKRYTVEDKVEFDRVSELNNLTYSNIERISLRSSDQIKQNKEVIENLENELLDKALLEKYENMENNSELNFEYGNGTMFLDLIDQQNNQALENRERFVEQQNNNNHRHVVISKKKMLFSIPIGLGVGFSMMPIFNNEIRQLENYGINVHQYESSLYVSTINTLVFTTICSMVGMYNFLITNEERQGIELSKCDTLKLHLGKITAFASSLIPASMLWQVELNNKVVDNSTDFDKYMMYAILCTIPLLIYKTIEAYNEISTKIYKEEPSFNLDSVGSKLFAYSISALASIGRGITFTALTQELCKHIGLDEDTSLIASILLGGVVANAISTLGEFHYIKEIFRPNNDSNITGEKIFKSAVAGIEGSWFSLPFVSAGLAATEGWSPLIRGAVFTPMLLSKTITEASKMYEILRIKYGENVNRVV